MNYPDELLWEIIKVDPQLTSKEENGVVKYYKNGQEITIPALVGYNHNLDAWKGIILLFGLLGYKTEIDFGVVSLKKEFREQIGIGDTICDCLLDLMQYVVVKVEIPADTLEKARIVISKREKYSPKR